MKRLVQKRPVGFLVVFLAAAVCLAVWLKADAAERRAAKHSIEASNITQDLGTLSNAFIAVAENVRPTVVSITVTETFEVRWQSPRHFPFRTPAPKPLQYFKQGMGSGVIVDAERGYILTNSHVVKDADTIEVKLNDERTFDAELIGSDEGTDIAVIQIKGTKKNKLRNLTAAKLGDSDALRVGEFVIAIGSPFQFSGTVTHGIVSAKGRRHVSSEDLPYQDFIQTDAAVNPGNSGGPLVNLRGEVVGINSAISSTTGGYMGISFAIPIKLARRAMEDLIDDGKMSRGYLGVTIDSIGPAWARRFDLDKPHGALVGVVVADSPAEEAGLEPYDLITELNGEKIEDAEELSFEIAAMKPGSKAKLKVLRGDQSNNIETKNIIVTLGEKPSESGLKKTTRQAPPDGEAEVAGLGLKVQALTHEIARYLGVPHTASVFVSEVTPGSPAAKAGLPLWAVITEVERQPVDSVLQFNKIVCEALEKEGSVIVRAETSRGSILVIIESSEDE